MVLQDFTDRFLSPRAQRGSQSLSESLLQEANMPLRRKLLLLGAPVVGAAAIGTVVAFSVPALAASPTPSPAASSSPSTTAPGSGDQGTQGTPGAQGSQGAQGGQSGQGRCPNM